MAPPSIQCRKSPRQIDFNNLESLAKAFDNTDYSHYQQGWRSGLEPEFRPAKAAAIWTPEHLIVHGDLSDDDIFNAIPKSDFNRIAIEHGDVFEIFLRPTGQDAYFEFHVSPNNQVFQLRIPEPNALKTMRHRFASDDDMLDAFKIRKPVVESHVLADTDARRWQIFARIPFAAMTESAPFNPATPWRFSFCRYDYTRPKREPVYSSTSPHSKINYHLVDEYGFMNFT